MSLIYMLNIRGARIDPCGTPAKISFHRLILLFTFVLCKRCVGNFECNYENFRRIRKLQVLPLISHGLGYERLWIDP